MKKHNSFFSFSQRLSGALLTSVVLLASCSHDAKDAVLPSTAATADATTAVGCPAKLQGVPGYPKMKCGCYTVSGLGANKRAFVAAGANAEFLASAMLETQDMDARGYPNGDFYIDQYGKRILKINDSYNAGAAKQNWSMIRQAMPEYKNYKNTDYRSAGKLNVDRAYDVKVYKASRARFGYTNFFAGHRLGEEGWRNPSVLNASKKDRYLRCIAGYEWTLKYLKSNPEYLRNDVRFAVDIEAI